MMPFQHDGPRPSMPCGRSPAPGQNIHPQQVWIEAFALTCTCLASTCDEFDLSTQYNQSQSSISKVVNETVALLDDYWEHLLYFDSSHLSLTNLKYYSDTVYKSGAPLQGVWGFIDCMIQPMCHPSHYQHQAYKSHKRFHGLKYQAVMLLNGLFGHLFGPIEGHHNNMFTLAKSGLMDKCIIHTKLPDTSEGAGEVGGVVYESASGTDTPNRPHYLQLFGDLAYGFADHKLFPKARMNQRPTRMEHVNVKG